MKTGWTPIVEDPGTCFTGANTLDCLTGTGTCGCSSASRQIRAWSIWHGGDPDNADNYDIVHECYNPLTKSGVVTSCDPTLVDEGIPEGSPGSPTASPTASPTIAPAVLPLSFPTFSTDTVSPTLYPYQAGYYVEGTRTAREPMEVRGVSLNLGLSYNGLWCSGIYQHHQLILNGAAVGQFAIQPGDTVIQRNFTLFTTIPSSSSFLIRIRTTHTVRAGCGTARFSDPGSTIELYESANGLLATPPISADSFNAQQGSSEKEPAAESTGMAVDPMTNLASTS